MRRTERRKRHQIDFRSLLVYKDSPLRSRRYIVQSRHRHTHTRAHANKEVAYYTNWMKETSLTHFDWVETSDSSSSKLPTKFVFWRRQSNRRDSSAGHKACLIWCAINYSSRFSNETKEETSVCISTTFSTTVSISFTSSHKEILSFSLSYPRLRYFDDKVLIARKRNKDLSSSHHRPARRIDVPVRNVMEILHRFPTAMIDE